MPKSLPALARVKAKSTQVGDAISSIPVPGHTTELTTAIDDNVSGFLDRARTDMNTLVIEIRVPDPITVVLDVAFEVRNGITGLSNVFCGRRETSGSLNYKEWSKSSWSSGTRA